MFYSVSVSLTFEAETKDHAMAVAHYLAEKLERETPAFKTEMTLGDDYELLT